MRSASPALREALTRSHQVATRVEILDAGAVEMTIDTVIDGAVTLDQTAAIRGRADLTLVDDGELGLVPTSAYHPLAPYGNEFRVSRGVLLPTGPELVPVGIFRIDNVNVDDDPGALTLQLAGQDRSARVADAKFEEPYQVAAGTNVAVAIRDTIQLGVQGLSFDFADVDAVTPLLNAEEGGDRWAFCQEMAKTVGMTPLLRCAAVVCSASDHRARRRRRRELVEGEGGVLLKAGSQWARAGAFNRVIATGENTGEAAPVRGVATDDNPLSPTYYYGPFGPVPYFYKSQLITSDDQAAAAARGLLAKQLGTTQSINFGAIVNPTLEPNDVLAITRARAGIDERHIVDQLTIPLTAEQPMTGRTRAIQTAG